MKIFRMIKSEEMVKYRLENERKGGQGRKGVGV